MNKLDIATVVDNHLCYSCGACEASCHAGAISFFQTNIGRLHPSIDYKICTKCGICYAICPAIDTSDRLMGSILKQDDPFCGNVLASYLGKTNDGRIYKNAQSGGMATQTLKFLFEEKLITHALVIKLDYSDPVMPECFFASSIDELTVSQKSVYTPINLLSTLKKIDELDGDIALVGLACQLEGIESLLKYKPQKYKKIKYKLGLICDRTLSYAANEYFIVSEHKKKKIVYRNKLYPNYIHANLTVQSEDGEETHFRPIDRHLLKEYVTPPRCQLCFNKMNLFTDIVYGDPWGIAGADMQNGESVVITRTELGQSIIEKMINQKIVTLREIEYQEILDGQKIDDRRRRTQSAFEWYRSKNIQIPKYFSIIEKHFLKNQNCIFDTKIDRFFLLEAKGRKEIVKYLKKEIGAIKLKNKIKLIIKNVLFLNLWRKS